MRTIAPRRFPGRGAGTTPVVCIGRTGRFATPTGLPMFGSTSRPPKPPRNEPLLLVAIAVAIAVVLTLAYGGILMLAARMQQGG